MKCGKLTTVIIKEFISMFKGIPRWLSSKESACNAGDTGDTGSIPESGRFPGRENGNPL